MARNSAGPAVSAQAAPPARPRRRRALRVAAWILLLLLGLCAAGVWYVTARGGPQYYGRPESLLPPGAAAMASCRDFSGLLRDIESLHAVESLRRDEDLAAFLLASPAWRKLQRERDKAYYAAMRRMARNFVDTFFGREVTLALLPPASAQAVSGLLVIARTDIGFEESLAELVAQYYPELALERREYRGHALYRYNAEQSRRAFTYCRFGKTVVVSLRSADWSWLEAVVDRRIGTDPEGAPTASLSDEPRFAEASAAAPVQRGLAAYLNPRSLPDAMRSFPGKSSGSASWAFWVDYFDEKLAPAQWGTIRLQLENGVRFDSFWKTADSTPASPTDPSRVPERLRLPPRSPAILVADSPRLGDFARDLHARMAASPAYARKTARLADDWRDWTNSDLAEDWIEPLGPRLGIAITGLVAGALFPVPTAEGWWEQLRAEDAQRLVQRIGRRVEEDAPDPSTSTLSTPLGRLDFHARDASLIAAFNSGLRLAPVEGDSPDRAATHPLLAEAWDGAASASPPVFCFFMDFERCYASLQQIQLVAMVWSEEVRKNIETWQAVMLAARYLHALRLTARTEPGGVRIEGVISVD